MPVLEGDRTLFDMEDHGIVHRGISTVSIDLGLTTQVNLVGSDRTSQRYKACTPPIAAAREIRIGSGGSRR
jgi:hypothetical protein